MALLNALYSRLDELVDEARAFKAEAISSVYMVAAADVDRKSVV